MSCPDLRLLLKWKSCGRHQDHRLQRPAVLTDLQRGHARRSHTSKGLTGELREILKIRNVVCPVLIGGAGNFLPCPL